MNNNPIVAYLIRELEDYKIILCWGKDFVEKILPDEERRKRLKKEGILNDEEIEIELQERIIMEEKE